MKTFLIHTKSESCDHYYYLIEHRKEPTQDELELWLSEYANDKDEDTCYENVQKVIEISNSKVTKIPKKGKLLEFI